MLSFDITDSQIKIVSGQFINGRTRVNSRVTIDIDSNIIVNGLVNDIEALATKISRTLEIHKMERKDAVICISSTLIMSKEMFVPKAKPNEIKSMIRNNIYQSINVSEEYNVGFIAVADNKNEHLNNSINNNSSSTFSKFSGSSILTKLPLIKSKLNHNNSDNSLKVLSTSCPKNLIDSYKKLFSLLRIQLKEINVSCNNITKIIEKDKLYLKQMPMLLLEINKDFLNINIFENGQLSFSRFTNISPENYDDRDDYIFQAINENILRLLQYQKLRRNQLIENVVVYGDVSFFDRLSEQFSQIGISI